MDLIFKDLTDKNAKIVLFGAGTRGKFIAKRLFEQGIEIAYFTDNDLAATNLNFCEKIEGEWGTSFIKPAKTLLEEDKSILKIIITTDYPMRKNIEGQLAEMGLKNNIYADGMKYTAMVSLDYLNEIYFERQKRICGFILGESTIRDMNKSNIIIFAAGLNGFVCARLLQDYDIFPHAFCDNYKPIHKNKLHGKDILNPYAVFKNKEFHYVIAVGKQNINTVRAELKAHNINDYSIFFQSAFYEYPDFLRQVIISSINMILKTNHEMQYYIHGNSNGADKNEGVGLARYLLTSTSFWHCILLWLNDDFAQNKDVFDVLEIGPGYGLLSLILKKISGAFNLDWLSYGTNTKEDKNFSIITETFPGYEYSNIFGILEDPFFVINKKYDRIIMTEVFEHFSTNPVVVTKKIVQMLNDDGILYLSTPNWNRLGIYDTWKDLPDFDEMTYGSKSFDHNYHYNKDELLEIFALSGLKVLKYDETIIGNHNFVLLRE